MIATTTPTRDDLTLSLSQEIHVKASLETTFASLLVQMGPENADHEGKLFQLKLEAWPGGRWYRDLGDNNGHFWGHVQAIKQPTLLEIVGPLFMSYPVISNLQYRLSPVNGGTLITFKHTALGFIPDDFRERLGQGWAKLHERVRQHAEKET